MKNKFSSKRLTGNFTKLKCTNTNKKIAPVVAIHLNVSPAASCNASAVPYSYRLKKGYTSNQNMKIAFVFIAWRHFKKNILFLKKNTFTDNRLTLVCWLVVIFA